MLISTKWILITGILMWTFFSYLRLTKARSSKDYLQSELQYSLAFFYVLALVSITLFPISINKEISHIYKLDNFVPFKNILNFIFEQGMSKTLSNIVGNILLFIPLSFLIYFYSKKIKSIVEIVILCAVISLLIEVVQFTGIPYMRQTDIDDIILNTFGSLIGALICKFYTKYKRKK